MQYSIDAGHGYGVYVKHSIEQQKEAGNATHKRYLLPSAELLCYVYLIAIRPYLLRFTAKVGIISRPSALLMTMAAETRKASEELTIPQ